MKRSIKIVNVILFILVLVIGGYKLLYTPKETSFNEDYQIISVEKVYLGDKEGMAEVSVRNDGDNKIEHVSLKSAEDGNLYMSYGTPYKWIYIGDYNGDTKFSRSVNLMFSDLYSKRNRGELDNKNNIILY